MNLTESLKQKLQWFYDNTLKPQEWCPYDILYHPETGLLSVDSYVIDHMSEHTQRIWLHHLTMLANYNIYPNAIIEIVKDIPIEEIPSLIIKTQDVVLVNSDIEIELPENMKFTESDTAELVALHKNVIEKKVKMFNRNRYDPDDNTLDLHAFSLLTLDSTAECT
jgi:hypothetical protein